MPTDVQKRLYGGSHKGILLSDHRLSGCPLGLGGTGHGMPWDRGMVPAPGPVFGLMQCVGASHSRRWGALVHESDSGAKVSSSAPIVYFTANDFGLPSSNIEFRMLHAINASAFCDSG